jgi:predicted P-loop ATPase
MPIKPVFPEIIHTLHNLSNNPPSYTTTQDPEYLTQTAIDLNAIPEPLKQENQWIMWHPSRAINKKTQKEKILKIPNGGAKWQKRTATFSQILYQYTKQVPRKPTGLGFLLGIWHPFICVDIDSLTSKSNLSLIQELNSYTELSPSLKGVHIWLELSDLNDKSSLTQDYGPKQLSVKNKRDLFISSGYVTMTGNLYKPPEPISQKVRKISYTELTKLLTRYFNPKIQELEQPVIKDNIDRRTGDVKAELIYGQEARSTIKRQRQSAETVRMLLKKINVITLSDDIFEKVYHPIKLAILDKNCTDEARTPWLTICQAVHHNFKGDQDGLLLLHEWSRLGNKYDKAALNSVYQSFSTEPQFLNPIKPVTIASLISLVKAQNPEFPDITPKGKPLGTIENLQTYFEFFKFQFKYNIININTEITLPENICKTLGLTTKPIDSLGTITRVVTSELLKLGFSTSHYASLSGSIEDHAKKFAYNPIEDYFRGLKDVYDPTKDPFGELMSTIKLQDHARALPHTRAVGMFMRKWFIQVAAAACTSNTHSDRIFNNLLIFTGAQGIGKTKWVQSIFPKKIKQYCAGSGSLDVQNFRTDKVKQAIELQGTLICNINEIDTLFHPKKYSAFKQLLDENTNKMVMPYGRDATTMIRRTVFIGSTNKEDFLVDHSGNRRITIIPTESLNFRHDVDLDQLWAHVMHWYEDGEKWWMEDKDPRERLAIQTQKLFNNQNMYMGDEFLIEDFDAYFDTEAKSIHYRQWTYKQVRQVIPSLSQLKVNSKDFKESRNSFILWLRQTKFGKVLKKKKTTRAAQFYLVPPLQESDKVTSFRQVAEDAAPEI